jgi:hypothetical protein
MASITPKTKQECAICLEQIKSPIVLHCSHGFCSKCFDEWLEVSINSGKSEIHCANCTQPVLPIIIESLLSNELLEKYNRNLLNNVINKELILFYCPNSDCKGVVEVESRDIKLVKCQECQKKFCFSCRSDWHSETTCEKYQQWLRRNNNADARTFVLLQKTAKQCQKCQAWIEKNNGCNHMTCKCGYEFNWETMKAFNPSAVPDTPQQRPIRPPTRRIPVVEEKDSLQRLVAELDSDPEDDANLNRPTYFDRVYAQAVRLNPREKERLIELLKPAHLQSTMIFNEATLSLLRVAELKSICKDKHLFMTGTKPILIRRILDNIKQ